MDNFATREGEDKGQRWRATLNGSQSEHCKGVSARALPLISLTTTIIRCYHSTMGDATGTIPGRYRDNTGIPWGRDRDNTGTRPAARARRRHAPYRARPLPRVGLADQSC